MKKRLFVYTTLILIAGLLSFFFASVYITSKNNLDIAKDTVMETARICAGLYGDDTDAAAFAGAGGDTRITIISHDGAVLADSRPIDLGSVENHLDRPEVQAALSGAPAAHVRYSDTLGVNMIYYAVKADSGDGYIFIRTAIPVAKIDAYLNQSLPPLVILLIAVAILCFILSRGIIGRITKPIESIGRKLGRLATGEYSPEPVAGSYEEIDLIVREIDEVAGVLRNSLADLRDEKTKAEYILNNIGDGIFAVDGDRNIALINNAAMGIFEVTPDILDKNMNYLSYDKTLAAAVDDCILHEKNTLFEFVINGRINIVTIKRLPGTMLTTVILSDITDSRENEKRREEFFANASHELKTPLTAIKGFNELSSLNNRDEGIRKYIDGIARETDRMLSLIGDMLNLSELEGAKTVNKAAVSLSKTAGEARDTLSAAIEDKSMTFDIQGDAVIEAGPEHIYALVRNLAENAVRYGNRGGRVSIAIEGDKRGARLCVADDGIGISPEEQTRIFERFYRVEKSRSGSGGGTGLGLSIVKHICALYGWKLSLKSKPGVGTEVTVLFT